jgi:hypothetical protein
MENSNQVFNALLDRIQEVLNQFNCKSEVKVSGQDALLYGKFTQHLEKYTVVVHVKEADYTPVTAACGKVERHESANIQVMPSLTFSQHKSLQSNCSEKEQLHLRENFLTEAAEIGKAFLRKAD